MDAKVLVLFTIADVIDDTALQEDFDGDFDACVRALISAEGLLGVVADDYTVLTVRRADNVEKTTGAQPCNS